jgi:hypothetical protein
MTMFLIKIAQNLIPIGQKPAVFCSDDLEADQGKQHRPILGWDEIAQRWPEGGRFPSLISIDQS